MFPFTIFPMGTSDKHDRMNGQVLFTGHCLCFHWQAEFIVARFSCAYLSDLDFCEWANFAVCEKSITTIIITTTFTGVSFFHQLHYTSSTTTTTTTTDTNNNNNDNITTAVTTSTSTITITTTTADAVTDISPLKL